MFLFENNVHKVDRRPSSLLILQENSSVNEFSRLKEDGLVTSFSGRFFTAEWENKPSIDEVKLGRPEINPAITMVRVYGRLFQCFHHYKALTVQC